MLSCPVYFHPVVLSIHICHMTHTHTPTPTHTHTYTNTHTQTHLHTCTYTCTHTHTHTNTQTHTDTHTHTHTNTNTHTYTRTHSYLFRILDRYMKQIFRSVKREHKVFQSDWSVTRGHQTVRLCDGVRDKRRLVHASIGVQPPELLHRNHSCPASPIRGYSGNVNLLRTFTICEIYQWIWSSFTGWGIFFSKWIQF